MCDKLNQIYLNYSNYLRSELNSESGNTISQINITSSLLHSITRDKDFQQFEQDILSDKYEINLDKILKARYLKEVDFLHAKIKIKKFLSHLVNENVIEKNPLHKPIEGPINEYISYLSSERGCTKTTINSYRNELVFIFCAKTIPYCAIKEITVSDLRNTISYFSDKLNNSRVTIARKINVLRSYFNYLEELEYVEKRITKFLKTPKIEKREKLIPEQDDFKKIIEYFEKGDGKNKNKALLFRFLYITQCRSMELIKVKIGHIQYLNDRIRIKLFGKGNKERIIPIFDKKLIEMINDKIREEKLEQHDYLFTNKFKLPYSSQRAIEHTLKTFRAQMKLTYNLTPHSFRSIGATHSLERGVPLETQQEYLGHSSPNTTRIYAQVKLKKIEADLEKNQLMGK